MAVYSRSPPTMAPSRLAPNATVEVPTSRKRSAKIRFAKKIGANARATAAGKAPGEDRVRKEDGRNRGGARRGEPDAPGERERVVRLHRPCDGERREEPAVEKLGQRRASARQMAGDLDRGQDGDEDPAED